jgi:membrane protease YdiL (CAAX protease family)
VRALIIAGAWVAFYFLLARYGVYALPAQVARHTTLPMYLAGVQVLAMCFGVSAVVLATKERPALRRLLLPMKVGAESLALRATLWALLLAPLTYLCAHTLGMFLAYDTLIAELASRGVRAVQQQTGELGRSATQDTLLSIVPFTLVIAPLGEELLFRGAVFGALQALFNRFALPEDGPATKFQHEEPSPESLQIAGLPTRKSGPSLTQRVSLWVAKGGGAALVSGGIFGLLHADTDGGLGIVRLTAALVLGVVLGLARARSGALFAPLALHIGYNFLALGTMRGWLVTLNYPTKFGIPTILGPLCLASLLLMLALGLIRLRASRK